MATVQFHKFDTDGFPIEHSGADDDLVLNSLTVDDGIAMGASKITGLADGTVATDAATYGQLQSLSAGFDRKESCRVKATGVSAWASAGSGAGKTLTAPDDATSYNTQDGVLLVVGDRVLVDSEAADADNGIYEVTTLGDAGGTSFVLTRTTDADNDADVTAGLFTFVTEGTSYADTGWFLATNDPITVDTTALAFSQFAGVGAFTGGNGIDISTGVISVDLDTNPGLEFNSNKLRVDADDGLQLTAAGLAVDVSDFAGAGLEDDGSENLRIAAAAAGDGIQGGGGSALAVDVSDFAGTGLEDDGSENLRIAAAAAGDGLQGGGGSALAVDVSDFAGDGLTDDGSENLEIALSASSGLEMAGTTPNETLQIKVDGTTIQINGSNELEVLGSGDSQRTAFSAPNLDTAQTCAKGDPLFYSGSDVVTKADAANNNCRKYVGCAQAAQGTGAGAVTIQQDGVLTAVGSGWTPGGIVYLASGGGLTQTVVTASGSHRYVIGKAKNATDLVIEPQYLGKNA